MMAPCGFGLLGAAHAGPKHDPKPIKFPAWAQAQLTTNVKAAMYGPLWFWWDEETLILLGSAACKQDRWSTAARLMLDKVRQDRCMPSTYAYPWNLKSVLAIWG